MLDNLLLGFATTAVPFNLLACFVGALIGTAIGVLPGLGPMATIALLLPLTIHLPADASLIMLAGIYYGAQYGGSTTAILVNLPGESSSMVTCLDGNAMARNGRAGSALAIAALGSFAAGTFATLVLAYASPPLTRLALEFGGPEYFSLMVFGLVGALVLAQGSVPKAFLMVVMGLLFGIVGLDLNTAEPRYTFGRPELFEGISVAPVAMGLFGLAEIMVNLERREKKSVMAMVGSLFPTRSELRLAWPAWARGSLLGTVLGVLPGGGAVLASFAAYTLEKRLARDPGRFGKGAVEGVAAPEAANNAGAQTSFIPLLALGLPSNPVMALMLSAMVLQGIVPGPRVIEQQPALFWGLIASMWVGNLMLLVINLPLVGIWARLTRIPYRFLFPGILLISAIGVFSINNSLFDVGLLAGFGVAGYALRKLGYEPAPFVLGFVLGPLMEAALRRALILSHGDFSVFLGQPISLGLLIASAGLLALVLVPAFRSTRNQAFAEEDA